MLHSWSFPCEQVKHEKVERGLVDFITFLNHCKNTAVTVSTVHILIYHSSDLGWVALGQSSHGRPIGLFQQSSFTAKAIFIIYVGVSQASENLSYKISWTTSLSARLIDPRSVEFMSVVNVFIQDIISCIHLAFCNEVWYI